MFFNIKKLGHDIPAHKRNLQTERLVMLSYAPAVFRMAMSTFSLARNIAQSDLSEFLLARFLSNVSNVGKQCLKCPLHFSIIILSEKMVLASSSRRRALGRSSSVGGSWRRSRVGRQCGSCARPARLLGGRAPGSWRRSLVWLLARGGLGSWRRSPARQLAARSAPGRRAPLELAPRLAAWRRDKRSERRRGSWCACPRVTVGDRENDSEE
jgi:hypothetical protein